MVRSNALHGGTDDHSECEKIEAMLENTETMETKLDRIINILEKILSEVKYANALNGGAE